MGSEIDILEPNYRNERVGARPEWQSWRKQGMSAMEEVIRKLAYELWEQAGRPDGRSDEFWFTARIELERREETGDTQLGAPVRRRAEAAPHESAADWGKRPRGFEM